MPAHHHLPPTDRLALAGVLPALRRLVQAIAFWSAILLLAAYPAALLVPEAGSPNVLGGLIGAHAALLFVGHGYEPA